MSNDNILEVRHLTTAFMTEHGLLPVVDDVSFDIPQGKCVGIVGESGCGKSATAMSLVRLLPQPRGRVLSGSVRFHGQDLLSLPGRELRKVRGGQIGIIFQEPMQALNPVQRIGDQIAETLMIHRRLSHEAAWEEAVRLLEYVHFAAPRERVNEFPHSISGGMRQRALIAMALACRPELIIADEPTTALDVTVQHQVLSLLRELRSELGAASLLITHDLGVIAQNCDIVWVMYAGRMVESAPVAELFAHPMHAYTRELIAACPAPGLKGKELPTIPGLPPTLREPPRGCTFRPRNTLGRPELCSTTHTPELLELRPGHLVRHCKGCLH